MLKSSSAVQDVLETRIAGRSGRRVWSGAEAYMEEGVWAGDGWLMRLVNGVEEGGEDDGRKETSLGSREGDRRRKS